jgi:hypothetical protein
MVDASTLPSEALSAFFAVRPRMATPLPDVQDLLPCDCSHGKDQFSVVNPRFSKCSSTGFT